MWSFLQGVSARRAGFAALAGAALMWVGPAAAQVIACDSPAIPIPQDRVPEPPTVICTLSTAHSETDIPVAGTAITAPEPLQTQLTQVLTEPNGAAVMAQLNALGVLGPPGPGSKQLIFSGTTISLTVDIGPGTVLFGPDFQLVNVYPSRRPELQLQHVFRKHLRCLRWLAGVDHQGRQLAVGRSLRGSADAASRRWLPFRRHAARRLRGGGFGATSSGPLPFAPTSTAFGANFPLSDDALGYGGDLPTKAQKISATAYRGNGWTAWVAGTGAFARVKGNDDNFGFGYRTASMAGGVEKEAGLWLYGGAFSIGQSRLTQDSTNDSATVDTRRFAAYAACADHLPSRASSPTATTASAPTG